LLDGSPTYYKKRWQEYSGLDFERLKDKGWSHLLHPDDYRGMLAIWQEYLRSGTMYEMEYHLKSKEGQYPCYLARAALCVIRK